MRSPSIATTLTVTFAIVVASFVSLVAFQLDRMHEQNGRVEALVAKRYETVRVANEAAERHLDNARLTLHLVLVDLIHDAPTAARIAAQMAENSQAITGLMARTEDLSSLPEEKALFERV
jgi:hypothetical protein